MDHFERVEKLKERANVSYEEAKQALEACGWDMLDAMIYLEKLGKARVSASFSSEPGKEDEQKFEKQEQPKETFGELLCRFGRWCAKWIDRGNRNSFVIEKGKKEVLRVPVTLLIVLVIFTFWIIVPLMVAGMFFDMRYHFCGPDVKSVDINHAMDAAADAAESLKNDFTEQK